METLVKAAVFVLCDTRDPFDPSAGGAAALKRDVSLFLRSLQRFPEQPLPFALATYRAFFVRVAQWRHEEPSIDARHTVDNTRRWIELSSALERQTLDQTLNAHTQAWDGPFELTSTLLTLLRILHADDLSSFKDVDRVARLLLESLEQAAKSVANDSRHRGHAIGLLGILVDAFAELDWEDAGREDEVELTTRTARLFVGLVWRHDGEVKIAAGVLDRVGARGGTFAFGFASDVASTILAMLAHDADASYVAVDVQDAGPLVSITTVFRKCFNAMLYICYENARVYIQNVLHRAASFLLSKMLEQTIEDPGDGRIAELDLVVTKIYDLCDSAMNEKPWLL